MATNGGNEDNLHTVRVIFGAILMLTLLGIYTYVVVRALLVVIGGYDSTTFTQEMSSSLSLIGGLVSALVIAELAVTKPGDIPGDRRFPSLQGQARRFFTLAVILYLMVWLLAGLAAFIFGYLRHGSLSALTDMGQSWFGVAIAAGYSYFGIDPSKRNNNNQNSS